MLRHMVAAANAAGIRVESCAETADLAPYGILPGKCIDGALLHRLFNLTPTPRKDPGQRPACGCLPSKDIGTYDTCGHGCVYCYATH